MESFKGVVSSEYYRKVCLQYLKKKKSQKMHKIEPSLCFLLSFGFFSAYSFSYVLFNLVDKTKRYRLDNFFFSRVFFQDFNRNLSRGFSQSKLERKCYNWSKADSRGNRGFVCRSPCGLSPCGNEVVCHQGRNARWVSWPSYGMSTLLSAPVTSQISSPALSQIH